MAIFTKQNHPDNSTQKYVVTGQGTLVTNTHRIDFSKIQKPFPISVGVDESILGTSIAVDADYPTGAGIAQSWYEDFQDGDTNAEATPTIWSGEGKVEWTTESGDKVVTRLQDIDLPIKVDGGKIRLEGGAYAFISGGNSAGAGLQSGATESSVNGEAVTLDASDVINGGHGTATFTSFGASDDFIAAGGAENVLLSLPVIGTLSLSDIVLTIDGTVATPTGVVVSDNIATIGIPPATSEGDRIHIAYQSLQSASVNVRLNEIGYPFTLGEGETIKPIGNSIVFATRA